MLEQFAGEAGNTVVRIDRFQLPSILYEKAKSLDRLARLEPKEPFILYCSTIEVRKNHLMRARPVKALWRRDADASYAVSTA